MLIDSTSVLEHLGRVSNVRVYKFGGASLADVEKIKAVATFLKKEKEIHSAPILAVVSAMGKTTDQLIELAKSISQKPQRRELDMLLTVGERTSMSLMSLALQDIGIPAISFTGSQAGIITDNSHGNARILYTRPFRIEEHLKSGDTVVLAGFQGVSDLNKEITTLGRGGTDTTAVAMASHFKSTLCEFKKDVGGIFSADPKIVAGAKHIPHLSFKNLIDMTFWGGKFLHYRAAELASILKLPLRFSHFQNENEFTLVSGDPNMLEQQKVLSINSHKDVYEFNFSISSAKALEWIYQKVSEQSLPQPQILSVSSSSDTCKILMVGEFGELAPQFKVPATIQKVCTVTLTCQGAYSSELIFKANKLVENLKPFNILQDTTNLTFVLPSQVREEAIKILYTLV